MPSYFRGAGAIYVGSSTFECRGGEKIITSGRSCLCYTFSLLQDIAKGLEMLHSLGFIIQRDLKAGNIVLYVLEAAFTLQIWKDCDFVISDERPTLLEDIIVPVAHGTAE